MNFRAFFSNHFFTMAPHSNTVNDFITILLFAKNRIKKLKIVIDLQVLKVLLMRHRFQDFNL